MNIKIPNSDPKPHVKLIGADGNAYAIMAKCKQAASRAGWSDEEIKALMSEMTSGDYDNLLCVASTYFDVY
jgi:hypothetical protein